MRFLYAVSLLSLFASGGVKDGRQQNMETDLQSPAHQADLARQQKMSVQQKKSGHRLMGALPRSLIAPPLAPSFEKLQHLVDDVSKDRVDADGKHEEVDPKMLPCLLRGGGCESEYKPPTATKKDSHADPKLQKTQASIERAVTKLQEDLDMRTAEVVKEIERRAAEMRREIAQEAEQLIEAVKYLVTLLADSVTRADEMGEGFVREWFDEAEQRYVGMNDKNAKPLDDDIGQWDDDLKKQNQHAHSAMVEDLKSTVEKTRDRYGKPQNDGGLSLDQQLGLQTEDAEEEELDDETQTQDAHQQTPPDSSVAPKGQPKPEDQAQQVPLPHDTHAQGPDNQPPQEESAEKTENENEQTEADQPADAEDSAKSLDMVDKAYGFIEMTKRQLSSSMF